MIHFLTKLLISFSIIILINSCGGGGGGDTAPVDDPTKKDNTDKDNTEKDTTLPVITLIDADTTIEAGSTYLDKGAKASDDKDGDITNKIVAINPVNTKKIGLYRIKYNVKDSSNNSAIEVIRKVSVVDSTLPIITQIGTNETLEAGSTYVDKGATASDSYDGNVTKDINTTNNVNTLVVGVYTVTYNVKDSSKNSASQITRTVTVQDTTAPTIKLNGKAKLKIALNSTYREENVTTSDNVSVSSLIISGSVNTQKLGLNIIIYKAKDAQNNVSEVNRSVYVTDLIKTGQTKIYTANDDGNFTAGVDANFTRDTNNIVTDNIRGLMWEDDTFPSNAIWSTQNTYCNNLILGGYSDWRIPTINEISTLLDYNKTTININSNFQNTSSAGLYISSSEVNSSFDYSYLNFNASSEKINNSVPSANAPSFTVRCVRGTYTKEHNISRNNIGIINDTNNALKYQDDSNVKIQNLNFSDAINYCQNLTLGNIKWRLANINELQSIYIEYKANTNNQFIDINNSSTYWSSTTDVDTNTSAYSINFSKLHLNFESKSNVNHLICVSDM